MNKHEETKGVSSRDLSKDRHPGRRRPVNQKTSGSLGGASGHEVNSPSK